MQWEYDPDIKLNRSGNPDIEFYVREAKRHRTEAWLVLIHDIAEWLKKTVTKGLGQPMRTVH